MGVADMCWGADDVSNLGQQEKLGTRLIDEILQSYAVRLTEVSQMRKSLLDLKDSGRPLGERRPGLWI